MSLDSPILHPRTRQIAQKIATNLPHGLIIDGPVGIGVRQTAEAIAREIGATVFVIEPKKRSKANWQLTCSKGVSSLMISATSTIRHVPDSTTNTYISLIPVVSQ